MSVVQNFLRRWSTVDITADNALLFDEHLMGVHAIAEPAEAAMLSGLSRRTPRAEFAARYAKLLNASVS